MAQSSTDSPDMHDNGISGPSSSCSNAIIVEPSDDDDDVEEDKCPVDTSDSHSRGGDEENETSSLELKWNDLHVSPPEQQQQQHRRRRRRRPNQALLLCDAWFGFPKEKRPRRERVNAVSRQLANYFVTTTIPQLQNNKNHEDDHVEVRLVGTSETTDLIRDRMKQLDDSSSFLEHMFHPNTSLSQCFHDWQHTVTQMQTQTSSAHTTTTTEDLETSTNHEEDWICYLSPDAPEALDPNEPPPMAVVVGMLVDRRIAPNRSLHRCQTLETTTTASNDDSTDIDSSSTTPKKRTTILGRRLPLHVVQNDIPTHEPLNIDTVMELMHRWWSNYNHYYESNNNNNNDDETTQTPYRNDDSTLTCLHDCFVQAAREALTIHCDRHPNRPIHDAPPKV